MWRSVNPEVAYLKRLLNRKSFSILINNRDMKINNIRNKRKDITADAVEINS